MTIQRVGSYQPNAEGKIVWTEIEADVPEGCLLFVDELPRGAWADPAFLSNILDIMIKSEASNDVKDILMDVELEKLIYDSKN